MNDHEYECYRCGYRFEKPQQGIQYEECPRCCSISFRKVKKIERKELHPNFEDILKGAFK